MATLYNYGGCGVDVKLVSRYDPGPEDVFWSKQGSSYVLVEPSQRGGTWIHPVHGEVNLVSINGMGEIRWDVMPWSYGEDLEAVEYFGLTLKEVP